MTKIFSVKSPVSPEQGNRGTAPSWKFIGAPLQVLMGKNESNIFSKNDRHVLLKYQIYALRVSLATPVSATVMSITSSVMRCRVQVKVKPHCVIFLRRLTDSYILCI